MVQARVADLSEGTVRQEAAGGEHLFGCVPWSQALSYRVWLEGPWDCCERYMVLASAFWHLTHQAPVSRQDKSGSGSFGASSESTSFMGDAPNLFRAAIAHSQALRRRALRQIPLAGLRLYALHPWACTCQTPWRKRAKNASSPGLKGLIRLVRGIFSNRVENLMSRLRAA